LSKQRRGLGKGLQALIQATEESGGSDRLKEIDIDEITIAPHQPRQMFDPDKLAELASSIKEHGVIQPVVVRPLQSGGYELIAGERRWRACKTLGYRKIPAVVKECRDLEASAVSLIENVQREDLNPLEEALAYHQLMDNYGLTQEEVSGRVGKSRSFVANMVRLLGLPNEIKDLLASGQLNAGHARALLAIQDGKKQVAAAGKIVRKNLNVRQAESMARALSQNCARQPFAVVQNKKLHDFLP
jgi:ParB family chromosome partitioning protein